jgi:hypothetical protein
MKQPCEAQVAWQICKLLSELDVLLWQLYWDEFEALNEREEAEKYWGATAHTHQDTSHT